MSLGHFGTSAEVSWVRSVRTPNERHSVTSVKRSVSYQRGENGVNQDRSDLVEERPRRHEVSGLHDDRRQDDGEEDLRVELDDLVLVAGEEDDDAEDHSDHDQQAALRKQLFQRLAGMKRWK